MSDIQDGNRPDSENPAQDSESISADSADGSLMETLLYGLSLPERTARSASAIVGGLANETAARLIPAAFRTSRSYTLFVQQSLDMMIHDIGGVESANQVEASAEESKLAQKAVGGLLDVAGAATLHLSPMTVLAVFSDLAYGSSYYLCQDRGIPLATAMAGGVWTRNRGYRRYSCVDDPAGR